MQEPAPRLDGFAVPRTSDGRALAIVLLLCRRCASMSRTVIGRGEMTCPCGGQRKVLRIFENQRRSDVPVAVERRREVVDEQLGEPGSDLLEESA
jgi:hypothetical protein